MVRQDRDRGQEPDAVSFRHVSHHRSPGAIDNEKLVMGANMASVMLAFMTGMYTNGQLNLAIVAASIAVFALAL